MLECANPIARNTDLEVGKERLLVEAGRLEAERVNDVVDLRRALLEGLLLLLGGRVGTWMHRPSVGGLTKQ